MPIRKFGVDTRCATESNDSRLPNASGKRSSPSRFLSWVPSIHVPGIRLSNRRPTMYFQNQPLGSDSEFIRWKTEVRKPAVTGTSNAQRNGFERTKLDTNSSQPIDGSAHSA